MPASLMYFCSGKLMHHSSGVDRLTKPNNTAILVHGVSLSLRGSGRLDTRLDTPPISYRHHPVSRLAHRKLGHSPIQIRPLGGQNRPVASQNRLDFGSRYESRQPAETTQWTAMGRGWASEGVRGRIDDPELIRGRTRKSAAWAKDALAWTAGPARIGVLRRNPAKGATLSFKRDHCFLKGPAPSAGYWPLLMMAHTSVLKAYRL